MGGYENNAINLFPVRQICIVDSGHAIGKFETSLGFIYAECLGYNGSYSFSLFTFCVYYFVFYAIYFCAFDQLNCNRNIFTPAPF